MPRPPSARERGCGRSPIFDQRQQLIDRERQHGGARGSRTARTPSSGFCSLQDVVAEAGLPDRGRQRRGPDHPDRRGADARHHHRQRQRQLHREQRLPRRHADALRRFQDCRLHALQAGDGVAQHRQHRIQRQRQHRRQKSERGKAKAEPRQRQRRQRQQQRIEQRKQRQPRHRLHDAGKPEQRPAKQLMVARDDRERQTDGETERERGDADPYMVAEIIRQVRQRLAPARIGEETHAAPSRGSNVPSRSACRRGVPSNSPT